MNAIQILITGVYVGVIINLYYSIIEFKLFTHDNDIHSKHKGGYYDTAKRKLTISILIFLSMSGAFTLMILDSGALTWAD